MTFGERLDAAVGPIAAQPETVAPVATEAIPTERTPSDSIW